MEGVDLLGMVDAEGVVAAPAGLRSRPSQKIFCVRDPIPNADPTSMLIFIPIAPSAAP